MEIRNELGGDDGGIEASARAAGASEALPGSTAREARQSLEIDLDELEDSPFQVKKYDDARVKDLAESIRRQGLLQPATVRRVNGKYQLICGHARRTALRFLRDKVATGEIERASYCTIQCILLLGVDDARAAALTAIENLQRDDGTPLEQAMMVARARGAGDYSSVAETAEALGLPRTRVRQYLELADAPLVLQRSVAPGVLVAGEHGEPRRVALPITSILGARPYYEFFLSNRLTELKAKASIQRKRKERRGRVEEKLEAKDRELARLQVEAVEFATEKTEHLLVRAARQGWTGAQLHAHVRLATKATALSAGDLGDGNGATPAQRTARLYEDTGGRLTMWPQGISTADVSQRVALAEKLRILLQQLGV
jgi:ParB/RepB/Spo0J family partition protein